MFKDQQGNQEGGGLEEIWVTKETKEILVHEAPGAILVHKGHLEVVVLGLRVLKVTKERLQHKDKKEISVLRVQKVRKEIPVLKVPRVIKTTRVRGRKGDKEDTEVQGPKE